jgi:hypothetical protein
MHINGWYLTPVQMNAEDEEMEGRSLVTRQGAATAGAWNHSQVFSAGPSQGGTLRTAGRQTARTGRTGRTGAVGAASRAGTRLVHALPLLLAVCCDPVLQHLEGGHCCPHHVQSTLELLRASQSDYMVTGMLPGHSINMHCR